MLDLYYSMWEFRDKRSDGWFLMESIWPTVIASVVYVLFSKVFGPAYMKNREPIQLKGLMMIYNIVQVVSCLWMFINIWKGGWGTYYSYSKYNIIHHTLGYKSDHMVILF